MGEPACEAATSSDERTRQRQNITVYPVPAVGKGGAELEYRFQWTAPILVSPHNGKGARILGPAAAPLARLKKEYRF